MVCNSTMFWRKKFFVYDVTVRVCKIYMWSEKKLATYFSKIFRCCLFRKSHNIACNKSCARPLHLPPHYHSIVQHPSHGIRWENFTRECASFKILFMTNFPLHISYFWAIRASIVLISGLSVLWRCWLGGRKGIRSVKNRAVRCLCGYLSGERCRLAYGPADATATHCLLLR